MDPPGREIPGAIRGHAEESSPLHQERLDAVVSALAASGAETILDLGCGSGALLRRLLEEPRPAELTHLVGLDSSLEALQSAERSIAAEHPLAGDRVELRHGSFLVPDEGLVGFAAAVLVETIEHIDPGHLARLERAVFECLRPGLVIVTTPNREYNVLYGMAEGELRHADHRFEWTRVRFQEWATGVASRNRYDVRFEAVGTADPLYGSPTQMAAFELRRDRV